MDTAHKFGSITVDMDAKKEIADNSDAHKFTQTTVYRDVKKAIPEIDVNESEQSASKTEKNKEQVLSRRQMKRLAFHKWRTWIKGNESGQSVSKNENKTNEQVISKRQQKRMESIEWKIWKKVKQTEKRLMRFQEVPTTGQNQGHNRNFKKSLEMGNSPLEFKYCFVELANDENKSKGWVHRHQQELFAKRQDWLDWKILKVAKKKMKKRNAKAMEQNLNPILLKSSEMAKPPCKLKLCFDLSLGDFMAGDQFLRTFQLLHNCYSINQRASAPLQLYMTGYTDNTMKSMSKMPEGFNWDVNFSQKSYCDMFDKNKIIYLTSDSPNMLEELDYDKVYVIGALMDHISVRNFICFEKAVKEGVSHARLPLDKYVNMQHPKSLSIDHVYNILLLLTEGNTWVDAIIRGTWPRKDIKAKDTTSMKEEVDEGETLDMCLETSSDSSDSCDSD